MSGSTDCCCIVCINTSEVGIIEFLGEFQSYAQPGMNFFCCPFAYLADVVSLRIQQLDVQCETKTMDNVFVNVVVSVQYQVQKDKVGEAYYSLSRPESQIRAYVFDTVRSVIPTMELDQAFESKEEVASAVKQALKETMDDFGYVIIQALITDLTPDQKVKDAMNQINASRRLKDANAEKAEADKIQMVKSAEADAESKYLSGVGVAKQRKALVDGLRDSIMEFSGDVDGATPKDVIDLLLLTQYFDMLKDVGQHPLTNTVFLPQDSGSGAVRDGMLQAQSMRR
uniref:Band 7 domain-containing protein n=1 Tax=Rhizochromulina marina TaxID=1034831 RepID=A0A7S2W4V0_9STRA|mmetsp:Transcript_14915/g.44188  ORF Transcript_14915/g.44188 Transcript_14915/m.44188 type:complete len:284 (+) Transcript_14915:53-904(+)